MGYVIERIQVEEGFLRDLDLPLSRGLNVIIGGRGTGKTSVIELIRFCLGARAFTDKARDVSEQHAISVLEGGRVTVTLLDDDGDRVTVTRSAKEERPRSTGSLPSVTVLAQNEIEAIGAEATGRMHLIDRCRPEAVAEAKELATVAATLAAQTAAIRALLAEIDKTDARLDQLSAVPASLSEALQQQEALLASINATEEDQQLLAKYQELGTTLAVRASLYERTASRLNGLKEQVTQISVPNDLIETWPQEAGDDDELKGVRDKVAELSGKVVELKSLLQDVAAAVGSLASGNETKRIAAEDKSRELRRKLNQLNEGASAITRQVNELKESEGQFRALTQLRKTQLEGLDKAAVERRASFERLDELRDARFENRQKIATRLTNNLSPSIHVKVTRSAQTDSYSSTIASALRGSGLHHSRLAPVLAETLSPLELVEAVELGDAQTIADAASIPIDRAASAIGHLRSSATPDIISADIDDAADFALLDGVDYKTTRQMSIGQRCTVVLPILLSESGDVLIVDQPEDHLDNAYITTALVDTLKKRDQAHQLIFSSHNANIPVLGDADLVVVMESDGRRGFWDHKGGLDDPETVTAVTRVMEGGIEAFRKRAAFYESMP